jgi:DNA-binding transcriptional regulator YbjK
MSSTNGSSRPTTKRPLQIADATLKILAREGARRVTHRRIDRALRLPEGSTSYYFRTRAELLTAAAQRLTQLDLLDMQWQVNMSEASSGAVDGNHFADRLCETLIDWLSAKRERTVAKCELFLEASRDETLLGIVSEIRKRFSLHTKNVLRALGAKNPPRAAEQLLHFTLGATYSRVISKGYTPSRAELKKLVRNAVELAKDC